MTIARGQPALRALLCQVDEARTELRSLRAAPDPKKSDIAAAQKRFRHTLEVYAAAAEVRRIPLPHRLRVELIVYRSLDRQT